MTLRQAQGLVLRRARDFVLRPAALLSLVIFGASLCLYKSTLCPTLYWGDSGELVTAAWSLGIAHPPGSPLWCLAAHPFTWLPWGDVAYRVNLSSAFFAAAGCAVLAVLNFRLTQSVWGAAGAALGLCAIYTYWNDANVSEVYALSSLIFSIFLLFIYQWFKDRTLLSLALSAFTLGLGVTCHYLFLLPLPVFIASAFCVPSRAPRWRILAVLAGALALGLSVFLYLPIRAAADPAINWGDPVTWGRFWDHVTRAQYQKVSVQVAGLSIPLAGGELSFAKVLGGALRYPFHLFQLCLMEFGWGLFGLGCAGLVTSFRRMRLWGIFSLALFLFMGEAYGFFENFALARAGQSHRAQAFLFILFSVWIAFGIGALVEWVKGRQARALRTAVATVLALFTAVFLPASLVHASFTDLDKSGIVFARDFAQRVLESLPPKSILVSANEGLYFSVMYLQEVEGMRPDVSRIMRLRLDQNVYPEQLARAYPYLRVPRGQELAALYHEFRDATQRGQFRRPSFVARWIEICLNQNIDRYPIFWDIGQEVISGFSLIPHGLVAEITRPVEAEEWDRRVADFHDPFWRQYAGQVLTRPALARDREGQSAIALVLNNLALAYVGRGRLEDAGGLIRAAIKLNPDQAAPYTNLANLHAGRGEYEKARRLYRKSLGIEPLPSSYLGLGKVQHILGEHEEAARSYGQALRLKPYFPQALRMLARLEADLGRPGEAEQLLDKARRIEQEIKSHTN